MGVDKRICEMFASRNAQFNIRNMRKYNVRPNEVVPGCFDELEPSRLYVEPKAFIEHVPEVEERLALVRSYYEKVGIEYICQRKRREIAKFSTNIDDLRMLADDPDNYVVYLVADNPFSPGDVLQKIADQRDRYKDKPIFFALSRNKNTPQDILMRIFRYFRGGNRLEFASNTNSSPELLRRLAMSRIDVIQWIVARNPSAPADAIRRLVCDEIKRLDCPPGESILLNNALRNPSTPSDIVRMIAALPGSDQELVADFRRVAFLDQTH